MNKRIKYLIVFICTIGVFSSFSQVSELHLIDVSKCKSAKNKDTIISIEQAYKNGVGLYNDVVQNSYTDLENIEKLTSLFKIQTLAKLKLQEIWEQSDSTSNASSSKYFTEAAGAFKGLSDSINLVNPNFKTAKDALLVVEKSHQVILLQKFGLQVLFGCVGESTSKQLGQPADIPDILVNIDMIERFRKVWNEFNYPITYDRWVYKPSERKIFNVKFLADSYKDRFNEKKKDVGLNVAVQDIAIHNSLTINSSTNLDGKREVNEGKTKSIAQNNIVKVDKNTISTTGALTNNVKNQFYSVSGEVKRITINQNTQFEIKSLVSQAKISMLGVDYFTIQIAASKHQLVIDKLKRELYCTKYEIEEKNEDGWYKYLVGHFTSIDSANKLLAKSCITRGFVSGYNAKGRVAIFSIKQSGAISLNSSVYSIVYRVQIAASKQPLSIETIASIYRGYNPVNVSQEDGWYRYSIGDFIYINEAKVARDSCGIINAFIMPYHNQTRIQWPRKDAMEQLTLNQNVNSIYVVQVAASRKPLSINIIRDIIKVDYPLTMRFEDGWYKYFISAFTSFSVASEVASGVGVKGSFIATYKNGLRVKLDKQQ